MSISLSSPVTGLPQTGLTSPTYTVVIDTTPPGTNGKQWAVTALGGTQTGVDASLASKPFTIAFFKPKSIQQLGTPNPSTGLISSVPMNTYKWIIRKGVLPAANQPSKIMTIRIEMEVPSGAEVYDKNSVMAALSVAFGTVSQQSAGTGDTIVSNVM